MKKLYVVCTGNDATNFVYAAKMLKIAEETSDEVCLIVDEHVLHQWDEFMERVSSIPVKLMTQKDLINF